MERINPLNDIAFTKCFGEQGCEPADFSHSEKSEPSVCLTPSWSGQGAAASPA